MIEGTKEIPVALKRLKRVKDKEYNVEEAWRLEADALNEIRPLKHPHLVRLITAFKWKNEHYIVLEWGSGGNLEEFWETHGAIALGVDRILSYLDQLLGLIEALNQLHTSEKLARSVTIFPEDSKSGTSGGGQLSPTGGSSAAKDPQDATHVRHGDLKPGNILHFAKDSTWIGTLKIADLGLAKIHYVKTAFRIAATKTKYGTARYEAPQASIDRTSPRSRKYDIWSMGCIILESGIWILYGYKGLVEFWKNEEFIKDPMDSLYFTTSSEHSRAKVSDAASNMIGKMLEEEDKKTNQGSGSLIQDLLRLVQEKLLVVALGKDQKIPEPGTRTNSALLLRQMTIIVGKAKRARAEKSTYVRSVKRPGDSQYLSPLTSGGENQTLTSTNRLVSFRHRSDHSVYLI